MRVSELSDHDIRNLKKDNAKLYFVTALHIFDIKAIELDMEIKKNKIDLRCLFTNESEAITHQIERLEHLIKLAEEHIEDIKLKLSKHSINDGGGFLNSQMRMIEIDLEFYYDLKSIISKKE